MQGDGNFVVYCSDGSAAWATGTDGNSGAYVVFQDDGNLVVYTSGGSALWAPHNYNCAGSPSGAEPVLPPRHPAVGHAPHDLWALSRR